MQTINVHDGSGENYTLQTYQAEQVVVNLPIEATLPELSNVVSADAVLALDVGLLPDNLLGDLDMDAALSCESVISLQKALIPLMDTTSGHVDLDALPTERLSVSLDDVLMLTNTDNYLFLDGNSNTTVHLDLEWVEQGEIEVAGNFYVHYSIDEAHLYIDSSVPQEI